MVLPSKAAVALTTYRLTSRRTMPAEELSKADRERIFAPSYASSSSASSRSSSPERHANKGKDPEARPPQGGGLPMPAHANPASFSYGLANLPEQSQVRGSGLLSSLSSRSPPPNTVKGGSRQAQLRDPYTTKDFHFVKEEQDLKRFGETILEKRPSVYWVDVTADKGSDRFARQRNKPGTTFRTLHR